MASENRIIAVHIELLSNQTFEVSTVKEFAPEYGGGVHTFRESGGTHLHRALDVAREMVTVSPGRRPQLDPIEAAASDPSNGGQF